MPSFLDTTREERFFCSALMHVLLSRTASQNRVLQLLVDASGGPPLHTDDLEVYTEGAALRDVWAQQGDFKSYSTETHQARLQLLLDLLQRHAGYAGQQRELKLLLDAYPNVFMTVKGKIVSPGRWPIAQLGSVDELEEARLKELRWAFNAKPDMLLLSGGSGVLIEAKAASGVGSNKATGYNQEEVQKVIAELFPVVTRGLVRAPLTQVMLTNKESSMPNHLRWADLRDAVSRDDVHDFAVRALERATQVLP